MHNFPRHTFIFPPPGQGEVLVFAQTFTDLMFHSLEVWECQHLLKEYDKKWLIHSATFFCSYQVTVCRL